MFEILIEVLGWFGFWGIKKIRQLLKLTPLDKPNDLVVASIGLAALIFILFSLIFAARYWLE